jgi:hypothetical protein
MLLLDHSRGPVIARVKEERRRRRRREVENKPSVDGVSVSYVT